MIRYLFALALPALAIAPPTAPAYPLDGDAATGIRRLTHARLVQAGQLPGPKQPPGEGCPWTRSTCGFWGKRTWICRGSIRS